METTTKLVIQHEDDPDFALEHAIESTVVVLGRSASCDIVLYDLNNVISRRHAQIYEKDGVLLVKDLMSRNRTVLNERILIPHTPYTLTDGDTLRISRYRFIVSIPKPEKELESWSFQSGDTIPRSANAVRNEPTLIVPQDPEETLNQWQESLHPSDAESEGLNPHDSDFQTPDDEQIEPLATHENFPVADPASKEDRSFDQFAASWSIDPGTDNSSPTGEWTFEETEPPSILDELQSVHEAEQPDPPDLAEVSGSVMNVSDQPPEPEANTVPFEPIPLEDFEDGDQDTVESLSESIEEADDEDDPVFLQESEFNTEMTEKTDTFFEPDILEPPDYGAEVREVAGPEEQQTTEACKFSAATRRLGAELDELERLYSEEAYAEREIDLMEALHSAVSNQKGTRVAMALQGALRVS